MKKRGWVKWVILVIVFLLLRGPYKFLFPDKVRVGEIQRTETASRTRSELSVQKDQGPGPAAGVSISFDATPDSEAFEFKWIVPPEYNKGSTFFRGRAWAQKEKDGSWTLFDAEGNVIKDGFKAESVSNYNVEGFAYFEASHKPGGLPEYGFVDLSGDIVVEPFLSKFGTLDFREGLISNFEKGKYGFVNKNGEWVIPPQYDKTYNFSEGLAAVKNGGKWGYIDREKNTVIDFLFDTAHDFSGGVAAVQVGDLYGMIDKKGNFIVEPKFERIDFGVSKSDLIGIVKDEKVGFIDLTGKVVIDFRFGYNPKIVCWVLRNGRATVLPDASQDKRIVIDETGKTVFEFPEGFQPVFSTRYFGDYMPGVQDGRSVLIDKNGRVFILSPYLDRFFEGSPYAIYASESNVFTALSYELERIGYFTIIPKEEIL